jgi:tRNA threonylcarbamoyl adenosine modification protein YeaZ
VSDRPVLAFDTAGAWCAAAVLRGGDVLARAEPMERGQAERLMPMLVELMSEAGIGWRDLAAIGCGIGPGNFTGVRISVATARSLALALGVPAVGVTTFEAMAMDAARPCVVILDARREQLFVQVFGEGAEAPMLIGAAQELPLAPGTTFLGYNADVGALWYKGQVARPAYPLAEAMARIALLRLSDPALPLPAPLYLRPADAAPPRDPPPVILP